MKRRFSSKLLIFLLIIEIIIPHGFHGNTIEVLASQTGTVKATTLYVRSGPSTTADKIVVNGTNVYVSKGETVNILEEKDGWYYISLEFNGKAIKGYILSDYVDVAMAATPKPTVKPTATPKPTIKPTATPIPGNTTAVPVRKEVELKATVTAATLNVRSGPGTNYSKIAGLIKGNQVTVLCEEMVDTTKWYGVSFKTGGVTKAGYVSSIYVKLSFTASIKGKVSISKLKVHTAALNKSTYVKDDKGSIIYLKEDKAVTILDEITVSDEKWFKISFTVSEKKKEGYVLANQISFQILNAEPSPTPKPTATPKPSTTPKVTATPVPTPTPVATVTQAPTIVPTPSPTPMPTPPPTIAPSPTPGPDILEVPDITIYRSVAPGSTGYVCNTIYLNVMENVLANQTLITDNKGTTIVLMNGQTVTLFSVVTVDGVVWYYIEFMFNLNFYKGYVRAEYIYIGNELPVMQGPGTITWGPTPTPTPTSAPTPVTDDTSNLDFETKLIIEGFPESYKASLRQLHILNPNWEFKAYQTGLDWSTVINEESIPGKNTIPNSKSVEWKSFESGAYNWKIDVFTVYDGSTWVTASKAAIEYYMDPRNFLTPNFIFQFELLKYQKSYQNLVGVENVLRGTALYNSSYTFTDENGATKTYTFAETFIKAAEYSGVSPYHLASRVKQEVVTGATTLSNSVSGIYEGFEGFFNFYNIGANDSAGGGAIANGLRYAQTGGSSATNNTLYLIPWTNPYKSILGGSYFLGSSYINRGQDTVYLQKFNVTPNSPYFHQYMTNVEAPFAEGKKICSAYGSMEGAKIIFSIPVYQNMPEQPASMPTTMFNPNNRLRDLKVYDLNGDSIPITPTFSQTVMEYYLIVGNEVDIVEVKGATVSKKATIGGGGFVSLNVGNNDIIVPVIAENGDVATYIVHIVREESALQIAN